MKGVTKWEAKYFTHEKSFYPVPHTGTEFANVNLIRPLPSKGINPEFETTMKGRKLTRKRQGFYHRPSTQRKKNPLKWTCWRD